MGMFNINISPAVSFAFFVLFLYIFYLVCVSLSHSMHLFVFNSSGSDCLFVLNITDAFDVRYLVIIIVQINVVIDNNKRFNHPQMGYGEQQPNY